VNETLTQDFAMPHAAFTSSISPQQVTQALAQGRIVLAFQPVMQAARPDRPAFHEGLLRLLLPDGRPVSAGLFMPGLENGPLARALDRRALDLGLAELAANPGLRLSLNVAPDSLDDPEWHDLLQYHLAGDPTLGERLILELTETGPLPDLASFAPILVLWRAQGISLALDDFGAGHTAFRHLRDWRFDILKIDGRFSRDVHRDPDNQALMRALTGLAQHFETLIVAEGVETHADACWLAACGVTALQGFHFARPTLTPAWRDSAAQARDAG
jgi:EAL domain-containing protein (putative c-di-GMP-specific phosphodiesterase class I)